jgi:hypothetical protein
MKNLTVLVLDFGTGIFSRSDNFLGTGKSVKEINYYNYFQNIIFFKGFLIFFFSF